MSKPARSWTRIYTYVSTIINIPQQVNVPEIDIEIRLNAIANFKHPNEILYELLTCPLGRSEFA